MTDFEIFIQTNGLLKKDIAKYLGVSNAFITQICSGARALPPQKVAIIKANSNGWDTSMFDAHNGNVTSSIIVNGGTNGNIHNDNRQYFSDSPDVLRAQIDMLDERIKEKDAQIKEKDAQIKQLLDIIQGRA